MVSQETVVQTVVLDLETSNRKNKKIQKAITEYQKMSKHMSDIIVSFDKSNWSTMNPTFYRRMKEDFSDRYVSSAVVQETIEDVVGGYKSWVSNGKQGKKPVFGNRNYVRCKTTNITVESNDRGYGVKFNIIPYKPEWFHVNDNEFSTKYLDKIVNGDAEVGTCEIHKHGDELKAHLVFKWDVDVVEKEEAEHIIGVDIGENNIYSLATVSSDNIENVTIKSGEEFRHYRERLKQRRKEMMEKDDIKAVKECSGEHERYTEQVLHTSSREIIDEAIEYEKPMIVLEDLTNYRKTAPSAIHDWPFALFQEMIMYKAKSKGIPVETVDPRNTSKSCRNCGYTHSSNRSSHEFICGECGYEVHADVNAAINIAIRGSEIDRDSLSVHRERDIQISEDGRHKSIFNY